MPTTVTMTKTDLKTLAIAAYGDRWKTALHKASKMSREQLWRYAEGTTPISDDVAGKLKPILQRQIQKNIDRLSTLLKASK